MLPRNVKVTSETKHDNLWLKATLDKNNWFRLGVTRSGWRITGREVTPSGNKILDFAEAVRNETEKRLEC